MEVWKPIEGTNGKYEVSNCGRVRSLWRKTPFIRKLRHFSWCPYLSVGLTINGKQKAFSVHRLVAQTFIPNPENKPEVNHINGIKTDNRVDNLEWCTRSENIHHAWATGLSKSGESAPNAKLTAEQIVFIRENPNQLTIYQLSKMFGVAKGTVSNIQRGNRYKNAGGTIRAKYRIPDDIRNQIRAEYKKGVRGCGYHALAKKYGVNPSTVCNIVQEA